MDKERYEIDEQTGEILDNHFVLTPEDIVDRLNYLEEQLKNAQVAELQKQLKEKEKELLIERTTNDNWYKREVFRRDEKIKRQRNQLKTQPAEILDKVYKYLTDEHNWKKLKNSWLVNGECEYLKIILKSILKEYGGKDE